MVALHLTGPAEFDLLDIWSYIARGNPEAADRVIREIDAKLQFLTEYPKTGENLDHIRAGVRASPVGSYVIYYTYDGDNVHVYRILHGARNWVDLL